MLKKEQAEKIVDRLVRLSGADEMFVTIESEATAHLRFAANAPSTAGAFRNHTIRIASTFGRRTGTATANQLDDAALEGAMRRAEAIARAAPEDPEHMPVLGAQKYEPIDAFSPDVAERGAAAIAGGVATCIDRARKRGLVAAGFAQASTATSVVGSSRGLFGYFPHTSVEITQTVRTSDGAGSGWAGQVGRRLQDIDFAHSAETAIEKALAAKDPQPLDPGRYVTILEPACVASLVEAMIVGMDARSADEGRSVFSQPGGATRVGERLFPDSVTLLSDPDHAEVKGLPWGQDGVPQTRRYWVKEGVVESLIYDRFWARERAKEPVPRPSNMIMTGGTGRTADLIRGTKRGVLITSLWYIRIVDPRSMLLTGLTRDGVFWIEDGRIARPLTNFRWNDSPIRVLKGIEAMSASHRVASRRPSPIIAVPAVRIREFELSSVSDAV